MPHVNEEHCRVDQFNLFDNENEWLKHEMVANTDDDDIARPDRQSGFRSLIIARQQGASDQVFSY
jgi:hypothetical protein